MQIHLRGGSLPVAPQLLLGRGIASCPDDPYLSRRTCVLAYDQPTGTASVTWMGRQCGLLCSRRIAVGSAYTAASLQTQLMQEGSQCLLNDGDLVILLGQSGRYPVLIGLSGSGRPSGREWAAIEATALAMAEHAAKAELALMADQGRRQRVQKAAQQASRGGADAELLVWRRGQALRDSTCTALSGDSSGGDGAGDGEDARRRRHGRNAALSELVHSGVPMGDANDALSTAALGAAAEPEVEATGRTHQGRRPAGVVARPATDARVVRSHADVRRAFERYDDNASGLLDHR